MNKTILLVDDSPTHRSLIRVFLAGHDFGFVEAESGPAALDLLQTAAVDLVIADINMPGMDGLTFVRKLRALPQRELRTLPVLLLTGEKDRAVIADAHACGADELLHKPVSSAGILDAAVRLLERPRTRPPPSSLRPRARGSSHDDGRR